MTTPLHPLNTGFVWPDRPKTGLRRLGVTEIAQYNEASYCVLRGALGADAVGTLLAEIDPIEARICRYVIRLDDGRDIPYGADNMTFAQDLVQEAPAVRALCRSGLFAGLVHDLVGPDVRLYWNQAVYKKPGGGRTFPWHQDNGYTFVTPQCYLTCWIALTAATPENGCPWVLPGHHRRGTLRHRMDENGLAIEGIGESAEGGIAVPLAAGDMVLFSSLTPHRTGPNRTLHTRKALILQFAAEGTARVMPDGRLVPQNDPVRNMPIIGCGQAAP